MKQVLRETKLKIRSQLRSEQAGRVVGGEVSVVEGAGERAAPLETLRVAEVRGVSVLGYDRYGAEYADRLGVVFVELDTCPSVQGRSW